MQFLLDFQPWSPQKSDSGRYLLPDASTSTFFRIVTILLAQELNSLSRSTIVAVDEMLITGQKWKRKRLALFAKRGPLNGRRTIAPFMVVGSVYGTANLQKAPACWDKMYSWASAA